MAAAVASGVPREFVSVQLLEPNTEHPPVSLLFI